MTEDPTLLTRVLSQLKNNPGVVAIILVATIAVGLANFSEAIEKIVDLVRRVKPTNPAPAKAGGGAPAGLWSCRAENSAGNMYIIDQLNPQSKESDIAVYEKGNALGQEGVYVGTASLRMTTDNSSRSLSGIGRIGSRNIRIQALGRTVAFSVDDDAVPTTALGRCSLFTEAASAEMRENVRNCLEIARRNGGVSEVARFGCQSDPSQYQQLIEREFKSLHPNHSALPPVRVPLATC